MSVDAGTVNKRDSWSGVSAPSNNKPTKKRAEVILGTLDIAVCSFIVSPLVIACWRGTWQLFDIYSYYFPPWEGFLAGISIHLIIALAQNSFHDLLVNKRKCWGLKLLSFACTKLYTIVFNTATILYWRSAWLITDEYFGVTVSSSGQTFIENGFKALVFFPGCFLILFLMKCLRNLTSTPLQICLDYGDDMFLFPNMFKWKPDETLALYFLDSTFSVVVVSTLTLLVWRGVWLLIDLYFIPSDFVLSCWISTIVSYVMLALVFMIQNSMKQICNELEGIPMLLAADFYILLAFTAVIFMWRGIWGLIDIYFLPNDPELSCWLTTLIPFVVLSILRCSNSLLARGVYIDADEQDGSCVLFTCCYLRDVYVQEKAKKLMFWKRREQKYTAMTIATTKNMKDIETNDIHR